MSQIRSQSAVMDTLEERRMLSASLSKGGTLTVEGGSHSDSIYLTLRRHDRAHLDVAVNGTVTAFDAAKVKHIVILGGRRNDNIKIDDRNGVVGGTHLEDGGDGNDSLIGDAGDDSLNGGAGDDSLVGNAGDDSLNGGDGNDHEEGDLGDDSLNGNAGDDDLNGDTGDDSITGGDGVDHFHGNDDTTGEIHDQGNDDVNDDNGGGGHHDVLTSVKLKKDIFAT